MAKFSGVIGYQEEVEVAPGVFEPVFQEISARGDILQKNHRWNAQNFSTISADSSSERISIGGDSFRMRLCRQKRIRYIKYEGDDTKYSVIDASVDRPRIVLSVGGVFHE